MRYGDYFHVAVHDCECRGRRSTSREIDIVTGPGWLLTVRHPSNDGTPVDLDEVARRFELQRRSTTRRTGLTEQGFLLWALFDVIVDRYFEVTDAIDDRLDDIEEVVFTENPPPASPARSSPCAAT